MAKLVELKDAAEQLGISPEALTEMVDQKKIFGYRDGPSWKFKPTEIERVATELGQSGGGEVDSAQGALGSSDDDEMIDVDELQLDDDSADDADSILISEEELGRSDDSTSSTIIGKAGVDVQPSDSDINIADADDGGSDLSLGGGADSDLTLAGDSDLSLADSDLDLKAGASDVLAGDSDLLSIDDGGTGQAGSGSGIDLSLDDDSKSGSAESSLALGSDALSLDEDELSMEADSGVGVDSSLELDLDDDGDAESGAGSDITLGASDSGINLANPSDSGISLEDVPSDLGSGIDSSLELGDEDIIELEADPTDPDEATELQTDDEFMLTPVAGEGDIDEESDDSGSQVIALDSDEFDESSATMLVPDDPAAGEDAGDLVDPGGVAVAATATAPAATVPSEEGDFSVWNIVGLCMLAGFMAICGLLALDVIRNIWTWNQPFSVSNSIMNLITGM